MKQDKNRMELWKVAIVIVACVSAASLAALQAVPVHHPAVHKGMTAPMVNTGNSTSFNTTSVSNPLYSEINMYIFAEDPALQLYITAEPGILAPMLTNFSVTMHAPGNSSYYVTDSALANSPTHIIRSGVFSYNTTITLAGTNSGVANFTFVITSGTLHHTSSFSFLMEFMSPTTYISYEHQKIAPPGQLTYTQGGEIAAGGIILGLGLLRLFLPVMRKKIQKDNKKEGMVLLASN